MDDFNLRYRLSKVLLQNETILTRIKAILKEDFCDYYAIIVEKYSYLLNDAEYPGQDFGERMNLDSEHIFHGKAEPYLMESADGKQFQLMRVGYYKKQTDENGKLVLSEIVSLKDNFNK